MPTICGVVCAVPHSVLLDIYLAVTYRIPGIYLLSEK